MGCERSAGSIDPNAQVTFDAVLQQEKPGAECSCQTARLDGPMASGSLDCFGDKMDYHPILIVSRSLSVAVLTDLKKSRLDMLQTPNAKTSLDQQQQDHRPNQQLALRGREMEQFPPLINH